MDLHLKTEKEELKKKFAALKTRKDIADLLEVSDKTLIYFLYRTSESSPYKKFTIKKKSGGDRIIYAPISGLKILQRKLAYILSLVYEPKHCAYGFCKNRDVVKNAKQHVGKPNIFNIDLKDFFPSIHLGRVIGVFSAQPFRFPREVAIALAQLCCWEGILPAGAPTSPIISNLICHRLDGQLQAFAKENFCSYSRYADDITFSTTKKKFPTEIVDLKKTPIYGHELKEIIKKNTFTINDDKVRLQLTGQRQEVTGLVVNEFVNIKRDFVREVRALLHSWKKDGLSKAQQRYFEIYGYKEYSPYKGRPPFERIVEGKINYIRMVKGKKSYVYKRLANAFNQRMGNKIPAYPLDIKSEIKSALWVIDKFGTTDVYQGTGFMLEKFGLVTAYHVVRDAQEIEIYKCNNSSVKYKATVVKFDEARDIAVLKITGLDPKSVTYLERGNSDLITDDHVDLRVAGFPDYRVGHTETIKECSVASISNRHAVKHIIVNTIITEGMSGGPMLNTNNEVVGVIVEGENQSMTPGKTMYFAGVAINYIDNI